MYILIGSDGFIGGTLFEELYEYGRFTTDFTIINRLRDNLTNFVDVNNIDGIFVLGGASSSPMYFGKECPNAYDLTIEPLLSAMEISILSDAPIVYATTSHTDHAESGYTCAMSAREILAKGFHKETGISIIGTSFYSVYGSNEWKKRQYANVISQMIWCGLFKKKFMIYGDGTQTRDFIHVDDIVNGLILTMRYAEKNKCIDKLHFGKNKSHSFLDVVNEIRKYVDLDFELVKNPIEDKYVFDTLVPKEEYERTKNTIGWKDEISLEDGIKNVCEQYRMFFAFNKIKLSEKDKYMDLSKL